MDFLYSIIIPHHNCIDLLQRCLDSIPHRTDVQIIIVDDNSDIPDQTHFPGITRENTSCIFTKEGLGAGFARNVGLSQVKGKWVVFADADDYFTPNAFAIMDKYASCEADLVYFHSISKFSDTGQESNRHLRNNKLIDAFLSHPNASTEGWLRYGYNEPWGKMIKQQMIKNNHLTFEQTRWGNDVRFSTMIGYYANTIEAIPHAIYCVTVTQGSLVNQFSVDSKMCRYGVLLRNNQYLRSVGKGQFQCSLMHSFRTIAPYGLSALLKAIKLGITYHANFFIGASSWIKNFWISRNENKEKEKYIIRN